MQSIKFILNQHASHLLEWAASRNAHRPETVEIPENGLVILNSSSQPICMGFIRKVEGGYGLIDGYISDPSQSSKDRDQAMSLLTEEIIKLAKELGLSALLANTVDDNTFKRSLKHGFSALPHAIMIKDLRK